MGTKKWKQAAVRASCASCCSHGKITKLADYTFWINNQRLYHTYVKWDTPIHDCIYFSFILSCNVTTCMDKTEDVVFSRYIHTYMHAYIDACKLFSSEVYTHIQYICAYLQYFDVIYFYSYIYIYIYVNLSECVFIHQYKHTRLDILRLRWTISKVRWPL